MNETCEIAMGPGSVLGLLALDKANSMRGLWRVRKELLPIYASRLVGVHGGLWAVTLKVFSTATLVTLHHFPVLAGGISSSTETFPT